MAYLKSPLHYPGSKHWLLPDLLQYIPKSTKQVVCPFIGGGSIELNLAQQGIRVYAYDIFKPLCNFYTYWLTDATLLTQYATDALRLYSNEELAQIYKALETYTSKGLTAAALFYATNKLAFLGGAISSPYLNKYYLRYDGVYVYRLKEGKLLRQHGVKAGLKVFPDPLLWQNMSTLSVACVDFRDSLSQHTNTLAICDPPYMDISEFYANNDSSINSAFDHGALFSILDNRDNWFLMYNDVPKVRVLYKDYTAIEISRKKDGRGKNKNELLIVSHDIAAHINTIPTQQTLF